MRIDCEMHVGRYKGDFYSWTGGDISTSQLEELMDEYRLDMCIVTAPTTAQPDNKALAHVLQGNPRFVAFAYVNPDGPGSGVPELERAVSEWGMKGLKLMPKRHGYEVDGDAPVRLMECAERLGLPVTIHSGNQSCLPWQIGHLARKFPTVPVIMNHMGFRYFVDGAINVAMETPNIYLDTCLVSMPGYVSLAVKKVGADRVIYGCDYPNGHPSIMIPTIKAAKLDGQAEELIMGGNLARILKITS